MKVPTPEQAFQMLLLQAADEGRGTLLFGESYGRARAAVPPFLVGRQAPRVYLEHPLSGEPFLDVSVPLGDVDPGTRIASPAAGEHGALLDWYASARAEHPDISCGFEVDTGKRELPEAAIHFQPRKHAELVRPFCEAAGEPHAADLYLAQDARMPHGWPLSFFGMFRGRPGSPLRACGYLGKRERKACAADPGHLEAALDAAGFSAYDEAMLEQVRALMTAAIGDLDFQLDIFPDGSLGPTFAIDMHLGIGQPQDMAESFAAGPGAAVMGLLEGWGAADGRWRDAVRSAFARALTVELAGGGRGRYAFTLMPQWVKARWIDGQLQPAKLYHFAHAALTGPAGRAK